MLICMRTTLNLDPELMRSAKHEAARTGQTLTAVIEDALRARLLASPTEPDQAFEVVTSPGKPRPGINLDDTASLIDLIEGDAAT
jgi:hypothetical protein